MGQLPFFPTEASTQAVQTDMLLSVLLGLSVFFTLIVVILVFTFGIRYRRSRKVDRSNPPLSNTRMEISWMVGLLILSIGTYTWSTKIYFDMANPPQNAMNIYVVGLQWMWKFQHPEGQQEINELHIPVGQPVRVIMTSQDVIHSFFVPAFRIKHDVLPGRYQTVWFTATRAGEYPLYCTQYCGTNHSRMIGTIYVLEPTQYQAWLAGGAASAGGGATGQSMAQAGQQLFNQFGCSGCHASGTGTIGPSLVGLFGKPVALSDGTTVTADENYIRESILTSSKKVVAGYQDLMPTFQGRLTEQQITQLMEFIKSLANQSGPGDNGAAGSTPAAGGTPAAQGTKGP